MYELPTDADAIAAAGARRDYIASGPGRVQAPPGTDHVIQQLGPAVIVYDWVPGGTEDEAAPRGRGAAHDRHDVRRRPVGDNPRNSG